MRTLSVCPELASARPCLAQDWPRLARAGAVAALGQAFIALSNMPVTLDRRVVVEPVLSLGYLTLAFLPLIVGHRRGRQIEREGVPLHAAGLHEVVGGAACGFLAGSGLSALAVLMANFNLRDPLVNWSPQLLELLSFNRGTATAVAAWPAICALIGGVGGALRLLSGRARDAAAAAAVAVVGAAVLESLVVDIAGGMHAEWITDLLYAPRGGLAWTGALALAAAAGVLAALSGSRIRRARARVREPGAAGRSRLGFGVVAAALAALLIVPMLTGKFTNELLANVGLFVLLALGLNIVVGLAGILDLGYVAFFAVGSYSAAVLTAASSPRFAPELPWLAALPGVIVVTALAGLFIGAPVIRMRGDYLAIVTLGFGEIIRLLFLSDWLSGWFGGAQGITNVGGVELFGITTVTGIDPRGIFYLVLFFCVLAVYISWRLEHSRVGRAWMAVREDETVAQVMGVDIVNVKLLAFVLGAVLGSFSGAIFVAKVGSVFPSSFKILVSIVILVVVIFGGMGSIAGVIAGSLVLIGVLGGPSQPGLLKEFSEFKLLIYGALLIWLMLSRPQGLIPSVHRSREVGIEDVQQDAWLNDAAAGGAAAGGGGAAGGGASGGASADVHASEVSDEALAAAARGRTAAVPVGGPPAAEAATAAPTASDSHRTPLLDVRGLCVSFGGIDALRGLDMSVHEGEIVSLIGPNGAGKTTLFNAVTATVPVAGGDILFEGRSLLGLEPNSVTKRGVARTFQNVRLFANMTVRENVMVAQHCRTPNDILGSLLCTRSFRRREARVREEAERVLGFFGPRLTGFRFEQPASSLSYANRRRLEIARAMAAKPKLILLDEPVAGMNPSESEELTELIGKLRSEQGLTIMVIEHDMSVVGAVSDRVVVLDHGSKIAQGPYSQVVADPRVVEAYLGHGSAAPEAAARPQARAG